MCARRGRSWAWLEAEELEFCSAVKSTRLGEAGEFQQGWLGSDLSSSHPQLYSHETSPGTRTVMLQVLYGWERGPGDTQQSQRDFRC